MMQRTDPDNDAVSMVRLFADVQTIIAAQRRIEWKLTGLAMGQQAVTSSLAEVREEIKELKNRPIYGTPQPSNTVQTPQTAVTVATLATANSGKRTVGWRSPMSPSSKNDERARTPSDAAEAETPERRKPAELTDLGEEEAPSPREAVTRSPFRSPTNKSRGSAASSSSERKLSEVEEEVLRLHRADGRLLAQLGRWKKRWAGKSATTECRLPSVVQEAGEPAVKALRRLLETRLAPLAGGVNIDQQMEQSVVVVKSYRRFGIRSERAQMQCMYNARIDPGFRIPRQCIVLSAGKADGTEKRPQEDIIACWHDGIVYLYAWLTQDEIEHYSSPAGDATLSSWINKVNVDELALQKILAL